MIVDSKDGLILWALGASGMILVYSAYKGLSPTEVLRGYFTNTPPVKPDVARAGNYDIKGPGYTTVNSNGIDTSTLPPAYRANPANHVPLRGVTAF